jgi:hypothetical protein
MRALAPEVSGARPVPRNHYRRSPAPRDSLKLLNPAPIFFSSVINYPQPPRTVETKERWRDVRTTRPPFFLYLDCLHKPQRSRIHAIPQPCRLRTIVEYVAKMRVAFLARHRSPIHANAAVVQIPHIF